MGVFRTVALCIAQAEANIEPLQQRWQRQASRTWTQWHTLPHTHPSWKTRRRLDLRCQRYISPLQQHALRYREIEVSRVETIQAYATSPWAMPVNVYIEEDRITAIANAQRAIIDPDTETFWTDSSSRHDLVGIGILHTTFSFHQTIGTPQQLTVYSAELYAIHQAVLSIRPYIGASPERRNRRMMVFSDSQAALKAIGCPRQQSGQFILLNLLSEIEEIRRWTGVEVEFRWVPAHAGVTPNEVVHEISRLATQENRTP